MPLPAPPSARIAPPRLDRWPPAVRSAELLRGTAVRCGPGLRLVSWPETPRVRATAIAEHFDRDRVAVLLTAAWIWGVARQPGAPLSFSVHRERAPWGAARDEVALHEYRLPATDVVSLGGFGVTTPIRTAYDLLRAPRLGRAERLACRLILAHLREGRAELLARLAEHGRPFNARVRSRLDAL